MGQCLALLLWEYRVRAMSGNLMRAPLLGYWILAVVVSLDPRAEWTLAVFGPPLVLIAWLDAMSHRGRPIWQGLCLWQGLVRSAIITEAETMPAADRGEGGGPGAGSDDGQSRVGVAAQ